MRTKWSSRARGCCTSCREIDHRAASADDLALIEATLCARSELADGIIGVRSRIGQHGQDKGGTRAGR